MFDDRTYKRTFYSAPQRVRSLVAAFLEPGITVGLFLAVTLAFDERVNRPELTLCMLVFALTFPGRDRFKQKLINSAVDIVVSWIVLLTVLLLCGYATRSLHYFEAQVITVWAIATPVGSTVCALDSIGHISSAYAHAQQRSTWQSGTLVV